MAEPPSRPGRKWAAVAVEAAQPHYLVCNADESEPGTFKDRVLLEGDPFLIVEAMTIAAFATGCSTGYLYLRGEYPEAEARVAAAIRQARAAGLLGPDIMGSGFTFDIELRRGAGAYICGEETALFESIEGKRGEPRNKPPFPVEVGLFGKPTVINNVETLANVPLIVLGGGAAFAAIGTEGSTGPKLFCLSGHVARPGVYEVEFGATLRDLIDLAGGVPGDRDDQGHPARRRGGRVRWPRGARHAADLRGDAPDRRDARFRGRDGLRRDVRPGRHAPTDCPVLPRRVVRSMRSVPGRQRPPGGAAGSARRRRRTSGRVMMELALLREIGQAMRDASICGLGQTASSAIESALAPTRAGGPVTDHAAAPRPDPPPPPLSPILLTPPARPSRPPAPPPVAAPPSVELTIDGSPVTVPAGSTILDACRQQGIDTPTLCYAENLTPVNVCRVCVVEVTGSRVLVPACSRAVEAGMEVQTDSDRVRLSRKVVLELLGSSVDIGLAGPAAPDGSIAAYAERYGADATRYGSPAPPAVAGERDAHEPGHHHAPAGDGSAATVAQPVKVDNGLYVRDYSRCILCYKCVEACGEDAQNTFAIAVAGRGFDAQDLDRVGGSAAGIGVRLLRQLHRRLPDRRAHVQVRVRHARGRDLGRGGPGGDRHDLSVLRRGLCGEPPRPGRPDRQGHLAERFDR